MKRIVLFLLLLSSTAWADVWEWQGRYCKQWSVTMPIADYMNAIRLLGHPFKTSKTACGDAYLVDDTFLIVSSFKACQCLEIQYKVLTGTFWKKD